MDYSILVPVKDEEESLKILFDEIKAAMESCGISEYEVIFIDDGSVDSSIKIIEELASANKTVKGIKFRRNFGKAAALTAGFNESVGKFIITMDADLQDRASEIQRFIEKLNEGYDLVSGWKEKRKDPITKTMPSKLFNFVTSRASGLHLHDFNCGFKLYRREVLEAVDLYGELHRYIPVIAHWRGYKVGEIPVTHQERLYGSSKYGFKRIFKGFFDLLTVILTNKFLFRPMHFFGMPGIAFLSLGILILTYLSALWVLDMGPIGNRPLLVFGTLFVIVGFQILFFGLISELVIKINQKNFKEYEVEGIIP